MYKKTFKVFAANVKYVLPQRHYFLFALIYSTTEVYEYSCNLKFKNFFPIFKIDFVLCIV